MGEYKMVADGGIFVHHQFGSKKARLNLKSISCQKKMNKAKDKLSS